MTERIWFNTSMAGERVSCHRDTVLKACERGDLHGVQRKTHGRWRIHVDCLDAWAGGVACAHQMAGAA